MSSQTLSYNTCGIAENYSLGRAAVIYYAVEHAEEAMSGTSAGTSPSSSPGTPEDTRSCNSSSSSERTERAGLMNPPIDEMKLGVLSHAFLEECNGSSASSLTTTWFVCCSSRRKRDMRIAVILRTGFRVSECFQNVTTTGLMCAHTGW